MGEEETASLRSLARIVLRAPATAGRSNTIIASINRVAAGVYAAMRDEIASVPSAGAGSGLTAILAPNAAPVSITSRAIVVSRASRTRVSDEATRSLDGLAV